MTVTPKPDPNPEKARSLLSKRFSLMKEITWREVKMMSIFTVFELIALVFGITITLSLLVYFGATPVEFNDSIAKTPLVPGSAQTLVIAVVLAAISLLARIGQGLIDARVVSNREAWCANRIRALPVDHPVFAVPPREIARGTHYYGRLVGATLHIVSSISAFVLTLVALLVILPAIGKLIVITFAVTTLPFLVGAGYLTAKKLERSSVGLIARARNVALWKADRSIETTPEVGEYFEMYFYRIFLISIFGYLNLAFIAIFMVALLINEAFNIANLSFGFVFLAYMAAQFYLGPLSRLIMNIVRIAAFIPFVEKIFDDGWE